jgi:pimeloyl-ACP methyl ester carboxylesterase
MDIAVESVFIEVDRAAPDGAPTSLHCAVCGPRGAPPLLLLHGFPEFWYAWRHQLADLARDFRCHALDLRGFNLSAQPAAVEAYRPEALHADLDRVIDWIEADAGPLAALVAHDWGGALAWGYAASRPGRVSRLAIANAPHAVPFARALAHDPAQRAASQYMNWLRAPGAEDRLAEADFARLFAMIGPLTDHERARYRACWQRGLTGGCNYYRASPLFPDPPNDPTQAGRMAALAAKLDPARFRVTVPTLVLWGMTDTALRPVLLEGLDALVPDLRLVRIEGAGHWLLREAPAAVNRALRDFLGQPA